MSKTKLSASCVIFCVLLLAQLRLAQAKDQSDKSFKTVVVAAYSADIKKNDLKNTIDVIMDELKLHPQFSLVAAEQVTQKINTLSPKKTRF